jgi:proton glutamate symport protein
MPATLPLTSPGHDGGLLTQSVLLAMVVGVAVDTSSPTASGGLRHLAPGPLRRLLRLIKCLIAPLLFATLVVESPATAGPDTVGKLAFRSLVYFEIVTTLALIVGLIAVNLVKPGLGVNLAVATTETGIDVAAKPTPWGRWSTSCRSVSFDAAAKNEALQITFFAVLFAVALSQVPPHHKKLMLDSESLR